jgi:Zn finger protein HypA/HybF involved in hydrogenase expression
MRTYAVQCALADALPAVIQVRLQQLHDGGVLLRQQVTKLGHNICQNVQAVCEDFKVVLQGTEKAKKNRSMSMSKLLVRCFVCSRVVEVENGQDVQAVCEHLRVVLQAVRNKVNIVR